MKPCNCRLMRAMSDHTRMNPSRRIDRLRTFNQRLQTTPESVRVLTDWNMKLEEKLVELQGRVIAPQKIVFNSNRYICSYPMLALSLSKLFYARFAYFIEFLPVIKLIGHAISAISEC